LQPKPYEPAESNEEIMLPLSRTVGSVSVEEAIQRRRSVRNFTDEPLSLADVSQLLWAAQGVTDASTQRRAVPSAGATFPLQLYAVVGKNGISGFAAGVYRYDPLSRRLERTVGRDVRAGLADAALGQAWVRKAPVSIVVAAVYERTTVKYGERGIRYVHIEVGHVGQNVCLQATALGLGSVPVGAFYDDRVQTVLQLNRREVPLYIIPVGHPA